MADLLELRLRAALSEYESLRRETLQKFTQHMNVCALALAAITAVLGWIITSQNYDLLLALPIPTTLLAFRYMWDQAIIVLLGRYLERMESQVFPLLLGRREGTSGEPGPSLWLSWHHYYLTHQPRARYYNYTILILFVVAPFLPAILFSSAVVLQTYRPSAIGTLTASRLPAQVHLLALVLYLLLAAYLASRLLRPLRWLPGSIPPGPLPMVSS